MTPTPTSGRTRRVQAGAVGAVALTAAIALPAFAMDRGGESTVDTQPVAATADSTTTTTFDNGPALAAIDSLRTFLDQQALDRFLAGIDAMSPEERFNFVWSSVSPEEQAAFSAYVEGAVAERDAAIAAAVAAAQSAQKQARVTTAPATRSVSGGSVWDTLAQCETGGNWSHPTVSGGFSGGLMFHSATWNAMGGQAYAPTASASHPRPADRSRRARPRLLGLGCLAGMLAQARPALIDRVARRAPRASPPSILPVLGGSAFVASWSSAVHDDQWTAPLASDNRRRHASEPMRKGPLTWPSSFPRCPTPRTPSRRTSAPRRSSTTTASTTRPTSAT